MGKSKEKFLYFTKYDKQWGGIVVYALADSKHAYFCLGWKCTEKRIFRGADHTIDITKKNRQTWRDELFLMVRRFLIAWVRQHMIEAELDVMPVPAFLAELSEKDFAANKWELGCVD